MKHAARARPITASWAVASKTPGRMMGYEVYSTAEESEIARHLIGLGQTITPDGEHRDQPNQLPWWTFAGGTDELAAAAVVSLDWSQERDGTRQPITPTRAVWTSWAEIAEEPTSYAALHASVASLGWPRVNAGPETAERHRVKMTVPASSWARVVEDIETIGFEFLAAIAAYVMDDRSVAIITENAPIERRIGYFDAIMALLPYGARNCVQLSTWASYRANHHVRLTFSDGAQPHQVAITSNAVVAPDLRSVRAREYLQGLTHAWHESDTADIVQHLLQWTEPLHNVDEISVAQLDGLRLPAIVLAEVRSGTATTARVAHVLDEFPNRVDVRPELLRHLAQRTVTATEPERTHARSALARQWQLDTSDVAGVLFREYAEQGNSIGLDWLDLSRAADKATPTASSAFAAAALGLPEVQPESHAFAPLASLAVAYLSTRDLDDDNLLPVLSTQRHITLETAEKLSLQLTVSRKTPGSCWRSGPYRSLLRLLNGRRRHWLRPVYLVIKGKPARINNADVHDLVELGPTAVKILIRIAARRLPTEKSIEVCWSVLATHYLGSRTVDAADLARIFLATHGSASTMLTEVGKARLDLLLLLTGNVPRFLSTSQVPAPDYRTTFIKAAGSVDQDHRTAIGRILGGYLASRFQPGAENVVKALWAEGLGLQEHLLDHFATALGNGEVRRVRALTLPPHWLQALADRPDLFWFRQLLSLDELVTTAAIDEVVQSVAAIAQRTDLVDELVQPLIELVHRRPADEVDGMLRRLLEQGETSGEIANRVREAIHDGQCDHEARTRMNEYVSQQIGWYVWLGAR